jgi:hypothetical protein
MLFAVVFRPVNSDVGRASNMESKMTDETEEKHGQQQVKEKPKRKHSATKWYRQTAFWAVIISVIALILSQLPPIRTWIPNQDVKIEVGNRIGFPSNMGIPGYQILVDLKNTGNRSLTISNLGLEVTYPNGTAKRVDAISYIKILPGQSEPQSFPITSIKLNAGEGWTEMVGFTATPSPSEEEEINRLRLQIYQSYLSKVKAMSPSQYNPSFPIEVDSKVVAEASNFFNQKFDLEKGIYKAAVICDINGRKATLKKFEFTLYDYHINMYKSQAEDYKYGWGVYAPPDPNKQIWAVVSQSD